MACLALAQLVEPSYRSGALCCISAAPCACPSPLHFERNARESALAHTRLRVWLTLELSSLPHQHTADRP